ncbi:hypothetical protein KTO58_11000 [Chitinophaga pendula]|uniref:hypothetical protein n=1 Tax=Chitinophaga TaxID=79328 RepID=UPI0012FD1B34|nr:MULTISPECIES: hypothetical protein [Chitinophaga]UCJ09692.1 hypothetical protein KTO58_11000 [Chitinophaga pendula]
MGIGRGGRWCLAILTILGALLVVHPSTYVLGSYLILAVILFLIIQYVHDRNYRGVLVELPSFALSLVIVYLSHPFSK